MAGRPLPRGNSGTYAPANAASRTNEYFVPRDGIDREVITADICRYLGNDALVRPGAYTNPETNQVTQGYFITAYRNLTSAMITDLKNDSARWEAERRRQSGAGAVAGTPAISFRDWADSRARRPNSPPVRYQDSHIRDGPQRPIGGNGGHVPPAYGGPPRDYENGPRYVEAEAPNYNPGAGPNAPAYGTGGYAGGYSQPPQPASFPAPMMPGIQDPRYGAPAGPVAGHPGGYNNPGNAAMAAPDGYAVGSYYQVYQQDVSMDDAPNNVPIRRTSPNGNPGFGVNPGANFRRPFPNVPGGAGGNYGAYPPPPAGPGVGFAQPVDNNYGRAPTMPTQGFSNPHDFPMQQPQQYEDPTFPPSPSRPGSTPTSTKTQIPPPGEPSAGPRRDGERAGNDRPEYRDRDRMSERELRDTTPPNKTGLANKPPVVGHHHYGRR